MNANTWAARREALRHPIMEAGIWGLLVSHPANRYYLSGFELHDPQCNETAGQLLISAFGDDWLFTDPRYLDAARRLWPEERIFISSGFERAKQRDKIKELGAGSNLPLGIESKSMSVHTWHYLSEELETRPLQGLVEGLRKTKTMAEIQRMERSAAVNHEVMDRLPELLQPGMTERQAAWEIEKLFRTLGASELAFAPIVAVDANAALPHAVPGDTVIREECLVLVDVGGRVDDYCSDQTRTVWVGSKPSERFLRTRELVREAQRLAIEAARPGLAICDLYDVAKKCFEKHGMASRFTHALGHGIGLETHEFPSLGPGATALLEPGMMVTVEPGLYDPTWGGIRWEHMLLITEDGARVL